MAFIYEDLYSECPRINVTSQHSDATATITSLSGIARKYIYNLAYTVSDLKILLFEVSCVPALRNTNGCCSQSGCGILHVNEAPGLNKLSPLFNNSMPVSVFVNYCLE